MDFQKELELFLDYYMPNQSSDIRDAVELDKSFHVINVPKLLAVSGLDESYVLRLTDSWNAWKAAKAQAVPEGFVVVPKEPTQEMIDKFPEVFYQDTYAGECSMWVGDETIRNGYKAMIEAAQEPAND